MSMKMTRNDLDALIKALEVLDSVPAEVKQITVRGHTIFLDNNDDATRGSGAYVVRGITDKMPGTPATRDGR